MGKTAEADGRENEGAGKAAKTTVKDITQAMNILLDTEKLHQQVLLFVQP
ncbi:hypothetical protein SAMN05192569_103010 [Parageobacillus thermantarcticus]|uniref:Uncharacterized protein n=1 Tax=Parageobacillus thermantarcticus TaxID=186116 RepID=A0A1I0THX5_9BACL|nr:hypothetical protein SAMN05192569_103010 [Parageobacillus thermantarcticus]